MILPKLTSLRCLNNGIKNNKNGECRKPIKWRQNIKLFIMQKINAKSAEAHSPKNEAKLVILKINKVEVTIPNDNDKVIYSPNNGNEIYLYNWGKSTLVKTVKTNGFKRKIYYKRVA